MRDAPGRASLFFAVNYFAQGMSGIAYEPVNFLLKDGLGLGAAGAAGFIAWMTLPFAAKPLFGLASDALPIASGRRRPYLLASSLAAAAAWAALALYPGRAYAPTLALLTLVNAGIAFSDVVCDGLMVQLGKPSGRTGRFQAVQLGTMYFCLVMTGLGGGWMAERLSYRAIFGLTSLLPLMIAASAFLVDEPACGEGCGPKAAAGLAAMARDPATWALAGVILLWNFAPGQGTSFFYYQSETLGLSKLEIGLMTTVTGVSGVFGAWAFNAAHGRTFRALGRDIVLAPLPLARWSALIGAPLTLLYVAYRGVPQALAISALLGAVSVATRLALLDIVARSCPGPVEATGFALFMAFFNLSAMASNWAGGGLYSGLCSALPSPHWAIAVLTAAGAASWLACLPLLRALEARRELAAPRN